MYHSNLNGANIDDCEGKRGMTDKGVIGHRWWQPTVVRGRARSLKIPALYLVSLLLVRVYVALT